MKRFLFLLLTCLLLPGLVSCGKQNLVQKAVSRAAEEASEVTEAADIRETATEKPGRKPAETSEEATASPHTEAPSREPETEAPPAEELVTDAYCGDITCARDVYDAETDSMMPGEWTSLFRIPQINLPGREAEYVNEEIFDFYYPIVSRAREEISSGEPLETSDGVTYIWSTAGDVLSLVITYTYFPESYENTLYDVYNFSVSSGQRLLPDDVIAAAGLSRDSFRKSLTDAMGTEMFRLMDSYIEVNGYTPEFNGFMDETLGEENLRQYIPFFNEAGELSVIACLYVPAGQGSYVTSLNLERIENNTAYNRYLQWQADRDRNPYVKKYEEILRNAPEDSSYTLYDIDWDGTPELIVQDLFDNTVYSFDGSEAVASEPFYSYPDGLYAPPGRGIIAHDGGMDSMRMEFVMLYTLENHRLVYSETCISTEECTYEEIADYLEGLVHLDDFRPVCDFSLLEG